MTMRSFSNYRCVIALDPDEWPGEWEKLLDTFPLLTSRRMTCYEFEREAPLIPLERDVHFMEAMVEFLDLVLSREVAVPNGGVVFVDDGDQVFKTNWELRECWDWRYVLRRIDSEDSFLQCFGATGAIMEVRHVNGNIQLQHLDYEHPVGLEGSRADLQGVILENKARFTKEVAGVLQYLQILSTLAAKHGKMAVIANSFGSPSETSVNDANESEQS